AGALRSRRTRALAAVVLALGASSIGPMQMLAVSALELSGSGQATRVARVLAWTPLAAPYAAVVDATTGRWLAAAARLAIGVAAILLLLWWWSRTLEAAMLGTASGGRAATRRGTIQGVVAALYPAPLRRLAPRNRFGAVL